MTEKARNNKRFDLNESVFKELNIEGINLDLLRINIVYEDGEKILK